MIFSQNFENIENYETFKEEELSMKEGLKQIISPRYRRTTICLWLIWFTINLSYIGFNLFLSVLMFEKGIKDDEHLYRNILIETCSGIPGSFVGYILMDTFLGRKWTLFIFFIATSISMFLFSTSTTEFQIVLYTSIITFTYQVVWACIYTFTTEVYWTEVRTTAFGICGAFGKVSGIISPIILGTLIHHYDYSTALYFSFGSLVVCSILTLVINIETRGKELDEVLVD